MPATQYRRNPLAQIFGASLARGRFRNSRDSRMRLFDDLESRILLAGTPTQLLFQGQPTQTAAGSTVFPAVTVEVADAANLQTSDTSTVFLKIGQGPAGATINNASAVSVSAVNGIATFDHLVFNLPGTYTVVATDGSLHGATSSIFTITAAATQLNFQHPISSLTAGDLFSTSVEVDTASGLGHAVVSDHSTVTLTIFSGPLGSTIVGTTTAIAVNGVFTFTGLSLTKAGNYRLSVQDGTLTGATSNLFTVSAGAAAGLVFATLPDSATTNATLSPAVAVDVVDAFGNIVTTDTSTVTLAVATGVPTVSALGGTTSVAAVNGVATFSDLSIGTPGAYTLGATDGGLNAGQSGSFNITGPAAQLEFLVEPSQTTAKDIITPGIQVAVEDALGHVIIDDTSSVTIGVASGAGTLSGTTTVQAIDGVATFSDLSLNAPGSTQLDASDGVLTGATTSAFSVAPAAVALGFAQAPGNVAQGSVMFPSVVVDLLDSTGALAITNTTNVTLVMINGPTGGSMNGSTSLTVAAVAGVATFDNLTFSKQGTYTLLAYDGDLVTETSVDFVVTAPAAKLAFVTQPQTTSMAGITLTAFSVRVTDSTGKTVTTDNSNVTLGIVGPTGATIGGTTTVTTVHGVATFNDIVLTVAGSYTFTVTDASLATAKSSSILITPELTPILDPNNNQLLSNPMLIVESATTSTLVGKTLSPITVLIEDQFHNVITTLNNGTASVHIMTGPSLVLNGTLTAKFAKGVATFKNLSINTAGNYSIEVDGGVIIPAATPYPASSTFGQMTVISPVINSMRAPAHSANYAVGATINLNAAVGSLVASTGIPYLNGTNSESVRLVNAAGATLETGTVSATGAVNFSFNDLAAASYNVQIIYDGDINHTGAKSPFFHFTVGAADSRLISTVARRASVFKI